MVMVAANSWYNCHGACLSSYHVILERLALGFISGRCVGCDDTFEHYDWFYVLKLRISLKRCRGLEVFLTFFQWSNYILDDFEPP